MGVKLELMSVLSPSRDPERSRTLGDPPRTLFPIDDSVRMMTENHHHRQEIQETRRVENHRRLLHETRHAIGSLDGGLAQYGT